MRDIFEEMLAARRWAEDLRRPIDDLRRQREFLGLGTSVADRAIADAVAKHRLIQQAGLIDRSALEAAHMAAGTFQEADAWRQATGMPSFAEEALRAAELARRFVLPDALIGHGTATREFAARLAMTKATELWGDPHYLRAFGETAALSNLLVESERVSRGLIAANEALASAAVPDVIGLKAYRQFLDAAGLVLPRWPRVRLLSAAEKRRRIRNRLRENVEPPHVKRAKSLVHKYEITLREIIDGAMAEIYGEDWAEQRLPICGCKGLLGRWRARGGDPLDHADYAHYALIMADPEHFEAVFCAGFDDREELRALIEKAGRLRARSHHPHDFTPEDMRDLRLTWRTIELGLAALIGDYEFAYWGGA